MIMLRVCEGVFVSEEKNGLGVHERASKKTSKPSVKIELAIHSAEK